MNQFQYENKFLVSVTGVCLWCSLNSIVFETRSPCVSQSGLDYVTLTGLEFTNIPPLLASKVLGLYTSPIIHS